MSQKKVVTGEDASSGEEASRGETASSGEEASGEETASSGEMALGGRLYKKEGYATMKKRRSRR